MKKRLTVLFVGILLCIIGVFGFIACSREQLHAPSGFRIQTEGDDILMWNRVANAKTYEVRINNVSKQTYATKMNLSLFGLEVGTYTVRVRAIASDYNDSDWASYTYTKSVGTGLVYQEEVLGEYTLVSVGNLSGAITIPDQYNGLPVTSVADAAFAGSTNVTSVTIGKNIRSIGVRAFTSCSFLNEIVFAEDSSLESVAQSAFQSCIALASVTLPDTVTSLGPSAFAYCRGLEEVSLPDSLSSIGAGAFLGCVALKQITVPPSVRSIGARAFADCVGLTRVRIDSSSAIIGDYAFSKCGAVISDENPLTDENKLVIELGDGVAVISTYAFQSCLALDSIVIPDSVRSIGSGAFGGCANLADVKLGSGVEMIGSNAFRGTKVWDDAENYFIIDRWLLERKDADDTNGDLRALDIVGIAQYAFIRGTLTGAYQLPDSLVYINDGAFWGCNMSSVTVGSSVKIIGDYAFYACPLLRTVVLGNNVEKIGSGAFANCELLTATSSSGNKNINIPHSVKSIGTNAFYGTALWNNSSGMIVVDSWVVGCKEDTIDTFGASYEVPSGTVGIADYAFANCEVVVGVYIPSTVVYIGTGAFYGCRSLTNVNIPSGVKEIKTATFYLCEQLSSITIPSGVEIIEDYAFRACAKLTSVNIPDSVTEIGFCAFGFCDRLADVTIGNSVEKIGEYAFTYCVSLETITLPDSLMDVSSYAFYRCSKLKEIDFGSGVRSIGDHAFYQCTMISELDLPDNITEIGDYAFYKCKAMWKLKIGDNVRSIGKYAFYECYNLIKVVIPDSVEKVDDFAFMNCSKLESVTLGVNLTSLGKHVFMNDQSLTVYAEPSRAYSTWDGLWNSQFRPVVWGCELSVDRGYVISVTIGENTFSNSTAENGFKDPTRIGATFAGWSTTQDGEATIDAKDIARMPIGTKLYSVWDDTETKPNINVTPDYDVDWDNGWKRTNSDDYFNAGLDDIL